MKIFTKNFFLFILIFAITTIAFRYLLSYSLDNEMYRIINFIAVGYAIVLFVSGWYLGKKDSFYLPQNDIGLRFSIASFILWVVISYSWFYLKQNASSENIKGVYIGAIIWGGIILFQIFIYLIYAKRKNIKGINKNDIFE